MNNYSFGSKPDFYKLSLLWQLDRNMIRTGVVSLLTEPLVFERDHNWHQQRRYLLEGKIRPTNRIIFDFLRQKSFKDRIDDVRCLADSRNRGRLFRRTCFCFVRYAASPQARDNYFAALASDRRMRHRQLLFFDPSAGFKSTLRSVHPPADYLDFSDFKRAAEDFPACCLLVNHPCRPPAIDAQGAPTCNWRLHTRIVRRLKSMLDRPDSLYLLCSPHNNYYLILRDQERVAVRIIETCRRAKLAVHRCR